MHAHVAHFCAALMARRRELPLKFEDPGGHNSPIQMRAKNIAPTLDLYVKSPQSRCYLALMRIKE
jgi:hypothetical protein